MGEKIYTTKEVADIATITKKTIRHYNKINLLKPSYIDGNGYWYFNEEDLDKLKYIQQLKFIGMTLEEIKEFLAMDFKDKDKILLSKGMKIKDEIGQLQNALDVLEKIDTRKNTIDQNTINSIIDDYHLEWLRDEFDDHEIKMILLMFELENGTEDHSRLVEIIKKMKKEKIDSKYSQYLSYLNEANALLERYSSKSSEKKSILLAHILMMTSKHALLNELNVEQEDKLVEIVTSYYDEEDKRSQYE
ncbi:MAG: MerR family transcriptional regulator [Clostridia bacterium]|nr:MerR family transcriptional regulator [Clostridia bacterium]